MKAGSRDTIKALVRWVATAFEDKAGSVSSKRLGFYISLWLLKVLITTPGANVELVWPIIVLIAALAGLTLPEWFAKLKKNENEQV